ncbi:hypothetical protein MXB_3621 [Myxobolus squamalis]|nr:hypothetical protein MXB_3621 [Myxobolus squamalis]
MSDMGGKVLSFMQQNSSLMASGSSVCPKSFNQVYGISLLLVPVFCVILVFIVGLNQSWAKKHSRHYITKNGVLKVVKEIVMFMIIAGVTCGAQFLQGNYFACFMVGAEPEAGMGNLAAYTVDRHNAFSLSVLIGWLIILSSLVTFSMVAVIYNIKSYVEPMDVLMLKFIQMRRTEMEGLLYDELARLAKKSAGDRVKKVLGVSKDSKDADIDTVKNFMHNAVKFERHGDKLETAHPNVVIE